MAIQNSFNWYCGTAQKSNEAANPNIALSVFALPIVSFVAFGLNWSISRYIQNNCLVFKKDLP